MPAASTQGRADGEFARTGGGSRQHETGDVRASDQQHEADRAPENQCRRLHASDRKIHVRNDGQPPSVFLARSSGHGILQSTAVEDPHESSRLGEGGARLQTRDAQEGLRVSQRRAIDLHRERDENVGRLAIQAAQLVDVGGVAGLHDPDHFVEPLIQVDGLADDRWVASENAPPRCIGEHDNLVVVGLIFLRGEQSALCGPGAENVEPSPGHQHRRQALRIHATGVRDVRRFRDCGC